MALKTNLLRRYIWLLETLQNNRLTFAQISDKWFNSPLNEDKQPLPLRTFHNHRRAIYEIFGINITNEGVGDYAYYIDQDDNEFMSSMQRSLVNALILSNSTKLQKRVFMDHRTEDLFLTPIYQAIKESVKLMIIHFRSDRGYNDAQQLTVEPYYLKSFYDKWFLIARTDDGVMRPFAFSSLKKIEVTGKPYDTKEFNIEEYIATPPITLNMGLYRDDSDMFYLERYDEQRTRRSRYSQPYRADERSNLREAELDDSVKQLIAERRFANRYNIPKIRVNSHDGEQSALPADKFEAVIDVEYPVSSPYFIVYGFTTKPEAPFRVRFSTDGQIISVPYQLPNHIPSSKPDALKQRVNNWLNADSADPHFHGTNREFIEWQWTLCSLNFDTTEYPL